MKQFFGKYRSSLETKKLYEVYSDPTGKCLGYDAAQQEAKQRFLDEFKTDAQDIVHIFEDSTFFFGIETTNQVENPTKYASFKSRGRKNCAFVSFSFFICIV